MEIKMMHFIHEASSINSLFFLNPLLPVEGNGIRKHKK
jgi:hypothetical protein